MTTTVQDALMRSVVRLIGEYEIRRWYPPKYVLMDPATYRGLRGEHAQLDSIYGLRVIVVPVAEMLTVVAEPWNEMLNGNAEEQARRARR